MNSFTRFAGVAIVILSLGFLVAALPTPKTNNVHLVIAGTDPFSIALAKLIVDVEAKINGLLGCATISELSVAVDVLVALFKTCADDIMNIDSGVAVDAEAKANIVACFAGIITLLVKVCAQVSVKFGVVVVAPLFAKIDVVLRLLLVNLDDCIGAIIGPIAKAIATVTVGLLTQVHLKSCSTLLGF